MPEWCAEEVVETFPDIEFVRLTSAENVRDEIVDADVLMAWTVNEEADMRRMLECGVAGIITDDPAGLYRLLRAYKLR